MIERRRYPRHSVSQPVRGHISSGGKSFDFEGRCVNISRGGALITIAGLSLSRYESLFRGNHCAAITFETSLGGERLSLTGRIVWHEFSSDATPSLCRAAVEFEPSEQESIEKMDKSLRQEEAP